MAATLVFLVELLISLTVFIWIAAMMGFADDAHRSHKATLSGRLLVTAGVLLASSPLIVTLYVGWHYYLAENFSEKTPLGWWLPMVVAAIVFPVCMKLVKLYDTSYKKKHK